MNSITVKHNLDNRIWKIDATELSYVFADIFIGFESETTPVVFNNLSFGLNVLRAGEEFFTTSFPKHNTSYVSTDQPFVETVRIELIPDTEYVITVWCLESDIKTETTYTFTTPTFVFEPYPNYEVL